MEFCKWAVAHKISGYNYDDGNQRERIVAVFTYPFQAEDFIKKCLPDETKGVFYIKYLD